MNSRRSPLPFCAGFGEHQKSSSPQSKTMRTTNARKRHLPTEDIRLGTRGHVAASLFHRRSSPLLSSNGSDGRGAADIPRRPLSPVLDSMPELTSPPNPSPRPTRNPPPASAVARRPRGTEPSTSIRVAKTTRLRRWRPPDRDLVSPLQRLWRHLHGSVRPALTRRLPTARLQRPVRRGRSPLRRRAPSPQRVARRQASLPHRHLFASSTTAAAMD